MINLYYMTRISQPLYMGPLLLPLYRGTLSSQCKQREWAHNRAEVHLLLEVSLLAMVSPSSFDLFSPIVI